MIQDLDSRCQTKNIGETDSNQREVDRCCSLLRAVLTENDS